MTPTRPATDRRPRKASVSCADASRSWPTSRAGRLSSDEARVIPSEAPTPEPRADHDPEHAQTVPERVDLRHARGARLLSRRDLGELEAAALGLDEELDDVLEAGRCSGDRLSDVAAHRDVEKEHVGEFYTVEL